MVKSTTDHLLGSRPEAKKMSVEGRVTLPATSRAYDQIAALSSGKLVIHCIFLLSRKPRPL